MALVLAHLSDRALKGQINATKEKLKAGSLSEEESAKAEAYLAHLEAELKKRGG